MRLLQSRALHALGNEFLQVLAGKSLRATITAGELAVGPIGTKSCAGSYLTFGVSTGAATCEPMPPASRV